MTDRVRMIWVWIVALAIGPVLLLSFRNFWGLWLFTWIAVMPLSLDPQLYLHRVQAWAWPLLGLVLYGLLSVAWSPLAVGDWAIWHLVFAVVTLQVFTHRRLDPLPLAVGLFIALVLLLADAVSGNALRKVLPPDQRAMSDAVDTGRGIGLALLLLPAAALFSYRTKKWATGRVMIILAGVAAAASPIDANGTALLVGLLFGLFAGYRPEVGVRTVMVAVGTALASPFALAAALPSVEALARLPGADSLVHRLIIWRMVLDDWLSSHVFFGAGARATRDLSRDTGNITLASGTEVPLVSVHPHNVLIEILYETGLVGYALLLAGFVLGGRALLRATWHPDNAAAVTALIAGTLVFFSVETSIWNMYTLAAVAFGAWGIACVTERLRR